MPFEQVIRRPFTAGAIQTFAPAASGVYGISNAREWIYIGETINIRGALRDHLQETSVLMQRKPTGFVFEVCDGTCRSMRQDRLVIEYEPVWNRRPVRYV